MIRHYLNRLLSRSSSTPARRPQGFRPRLETLEDRCVPAFTTAFNAATGALTVTGSAVADDVSIGEQATQGSYYVTDFNTPAHLFSGVKSIAVDMRGAAAGANDTVTLFGADSANSFLTGPLSITGAGGLAVGFASHFNVRGAVAIETTGSAGNLLVQTGTATHFATKSNVTLGATTITNRGAGVTTIKLYGTNANDVGIAGSLSTTTGSGYISFYLVYCNVAGSVTEVSASTASINFFGTIVGGFVSLNGTAANSAIYAVMGTSTIGTFFSVASGNRDDTIYVDNTAVLGLGLQPQQQTFGVDLKGGENKSLIGTIGPDSNNVIHGSLFHYGAGSETFELRNYTVTSFVTLNAQAGNVGIAATIKDSKISSFLSFAAAGAADDNVIVNNLSIGQNFGLDLGGGQNTTTITNNTYLGSYFETDTGLDVITFTGNTGFGDVRLSGNRLSVDVGKFLNNRIAGHASFISAATGVDFVQLGPAPNVAPDATNAVSIGKTLTVNLGTSFSISGPIDNVTLDNVSVKGDVAVTALRSTLTNTSVGGNLTFSAGAASLRVIVILGTTNIANTGAVRVVGNLAVATGGGNDVVQLVDATVVGTTSINTNGGRDLVGLESPAGNPGPSQFFGAVQVSTGSGDDVVVVGTDAANGAQFFSTVLFDGGDGADTLTDPFAYHYGGPPTRNSIP